MSTIPRVAYGKYVFAKLSARTSHLVRIKTANQPSIVFMGGFHGENTGDWAMGDLLTETARSLGAKTLRLAMRDAASLEDISAPVVIGGGAVGTEEALGPVAAVWSKRRFPVTLVGVDFAAKLHTFDVKIKEMCAAATSIGLRHKNQLARVRDWSGNRSTYDHADLVFAKPSELEVRRCEDRIAVNMLPLFQTLRKRSFQIGTPLRQIYQKNNSSLLDNIEIIAKQYVSFFRTRVLQFLSEGYDVVHVPFAPEDDAFARSVLPRGTTFLPFNKAFGKPERVIASSSLFLPTRFHAVVSGLRTQTPIVPIAYAGKSEELYQQFEFDRDTILDRIALAEGSWSSPALIATNTAIIEARNSASVALTRAVNEACSGIR